MKCFFSVIAKCLNELVEGGVHGGEADVKLLDDCRVEAVKVEQHHKRVVETLFWNKLLNIFILIISRI